MTDKIDLYSAAGIIFIDLVIKIIEEFQKGAVTLDDLKALRLRLPIDEPFFEE